MARKPTENAEEGPIVHLPLAYEQGEGESAAFDRADLIFENVPHMMGSYEIRVFMNNKRATAKSKRTAKQGYAGRFRVFGHGGCFGAAGHCDERLAESIASPDPLTGRRHPLTPHTRMLTVTEPLRKLLKGKDGKLKSLTLVPIAETPLKADRGLMPGVADRLKVSLRTYR